MRWTLKDKDKESCTKGLFNDWNGEIGSIKKKLRM